MSATLETASPRPAMLSPIPDGIPLELRERPQWVVWKSELRDGKYTKVPYHADGSKIIKGTPHDEWGGAFSVALATCQSGGFDGVGFVFTTDDPYAGVDLDGCRDPITESIEPWAMTIITRLETYCEVSPSGTGVKLFCRGKVPFTDGRDGRKKNLDGKGSGGKQRAIEVYNARKYFTLTGRQLESSPATVNDCQAELEKLHAETFAPAHESNGQQTKPGPVGTITTSNAGAMLPDDAKILDKIRNSKKRGAKFDRLWSGDTSGHDDDDSAADLALCNMLAFWCMGDAATIDRLFRQSGLMREKWEQREDYRTATISKALEGRTEFYDWSRNGQAAKHETPEQAAREAAGKYLNGVTDFTDAGQLDDAREAFLDWSEGNDVRLSEEQLREIFDKAAGDRHNGDQHDGDQHRQDHSPKRDGVPQAPFLQDDRTDVGNSRRLVAKFGHVIRYCHTWGKWLVWDGCRWKLDDTGEIMRLAKTTIDEMYHELAGLPEADQKALFKFIQNSKKRDRLNAMIALAQSEPGVPVTPDQLDSDPWLLNCPNGTIDLRTGKLRKHRHEDLLTKLCPTKYNPDAAAPAWEAFLSQVHQADFDLIGFLRRMYGYTISGDVSEDAVLILHGTGSNGKTTEAETLKETIGPDYALQAVPELLMERKGEVHLTERADLFGKRLVLCSETEQGRAIRAALLKLLSGGESIRARRMREDTWEFPPTHTLVLSTNHKPRVRGDDDGVWRRLYLVPFNARFWNPAKGESGAPELRADKNLSRTLLGEREGILAWLVRGCLEWQRDGLNAPKAVLAATDQYRKEEDVLGEFLRERCMIDANYTDLKPTDRTDSSRDIRVSHLHDEYMAWVGTTGGDALSQKQLSRELELRGFTKKRNNGSWIMGIALERSAEEDERPLNAD